ncbi:unnamed protein product [Diabrotica balteata]|uniref:Zinc transporter ZIP1 n=1 Tax=Diabrotica balteata TaxID=107213 RepID=A0A9N9XEZ9_DIABA|nr:unnamed protein product [Diabrotica balteata]
MTMESAIRNSDNSDLIVAKTVAMLVLGLASFCLGLLPIKLTKVISIKTVNGDKNLTISLLLCFGGGVLLFTTFLHLQPEVRQGFQHLEKAGYVSTIGPGIPLAELVFCVGFFFVYLIEEIVHLYLDRKHSHINNNNALHKSLAVRKSSKQEVTIPRVSLIKIDDGNISCISTSNKDLLNSQITVNLEKAQPEFHQHNHHQHHHFDDTSKASFGGFLVVIALSFHAIFEGLAVGLEGSVEKVWYLFAAIATHKLVIAFCVGMELVTSQTRTLLVFLYIGTFAVVTPLGIGAGIILSEKDSTEDVTSIVLQGMAAGTLLYVVFFEVLAREKNNNHSGFWQLLAIWAGFACMFVLQVMIGHGHDHNHEHKDHHHRTTHQESQYSFHDTAILTTVPNI